MVRDEDCFGPPEAKAYRYRAPQNAPLPRRPSAWPLGSNHLNSAAPQVLGQLFPAAARDVSARRHLVMLTSGAAKSVYEGWTSYGAAKAAIDQWVRDAGAEQNTRGGVQVLSVAPGTVDTGMQQQLRMTDEQSFPMRQKFLDLHAAGGLSEPADVADNGSVVDLRKLG